MIKNLLPMHFRFRIFNHCLYLYRDSQTQMRITDRLPLVSIFVCGVLTGGKQFYGLFLSVFMSKLFSKLHCNSKKNNYSVTFIVIEFSILRVCSVNYCVIKKFEQERGNFSE